METIKRFELVKNSDRFHRICEFFNLRNKKVLDLGCGFGEHLVHFGPNSMGITTTEDEVAYGKKNSLNIIKANAEFLEETNIKGNDFEAIWANNLFEHVLSPHAFLVKLREYSSENAVLILGVPVISFPSFLTRFVWFHGALASNHISFFTKETLRLTVEFSGWKIKEMRSFWFKNRSIDRLFSFLVPHIFIIAEKAEGFKYPEKKVKEWFEDPHYGFLFKVTHQK